MVDVFAVFQEAPCSPSVDLILPLENHYNRYFSLFLSMTLNQTLSFLITIVHQNSRLEIETWQEMVMWLTDLLVSILHSSLVPYICQGIITGKVYFSITWFWAWPLKLVLAQGMTQKRQKWHHHEEKKISYLICQTLR